MKRSAVFGLALLVCWVAFGEEGPDDQFIHVYNLIQQADALREGGQPRSARDKYLEAKSALDRLHTDYPGWNEKIVNYRRTYIADKLVLVGGAPETEATAPAAKPAAKPEATRPPDERDQQIAALRQEIQSLRSTSDVLQAKLREALSAQPASVDPRELAKAQDQVRDLEKENALLKVTVGQQQDKLAKVPDATALAEAQRAAESARQLLASQGQTLAALTKERDSLQQKLQKLTEMNTAKPKRAEEKAKPVPAAEGAPNAEAAVTALKEVLSQREKELTTQHARVQALEAEKATLEKRVAELSALRATASAKPAAAEPPSPVAKREEPIKETKQAKLASQRELAALQKERNDFRKRVAVLTRRLEDRGLGRGSAQNQQLAEELSILRARVQVYEARPVPYTAEEMALFKASPAVATGAEVTRKSSKSLPAGAAALVAAAKRAFNAGRFDEAERNYAQALKMDEKNVTILRELAASQMEQSHLADAEGNLQRALAVDAYDAESLSLLGLLRFRQDKYNEALDLLTRAAQLDPDNFVTQNYLGITLSQKGQRAAAETALRKAVQLQPHYGEAHGNLAVVYATQKPPFLELARWHYQKALAAGYPRAKELEKLIENNAGGASGTATPGGTGDSK